MKIPKEIYNHIEYELHMYQTNKIVLEQELERILEESGTSLNGQPRSNKISNTTESKALRRLTSSNILTLEKHIRVIESVLESLNDTQKAFFKRYYVENCKDKIALSIELYVSIETIKRYQRAIIYQVGYILGWITLDCIDDLKS